MPRKKTNNFCQCGCGQETTIIRKSHAARGLIAGNHRLFLKGHHRAIHRLSHKAEHSAYMHARRRCTNPKDSHWPLYGGRGIEFRFTSFKQFIEHIGKRPENLTLDRINNDGHYEIGNVRWATRSQQAFNRRRKRDFNV